MPYPADPAPPWSEMESSLNAWEELSHRMDSDAAAGTHDQSDSVPATLRQMVKLLSQSQRAQALHGRATALMARQVMSCMRGTEAESLAKTVQVCISWGQS